jgi:predicted phage terminase large subunit-like protein
MNMICTEKLRLLEAVYRTDFPSFAQKVFHTLSPSAPLLMNFHIHAIAYHLELVRTGKIKRLIINLPPRSLKSIVTSIAFPAFCLGREPGKRLIVISYGADLAIKLSNDFRTVMNTLWYKALFPLVDTAGAKNTESELGTSRGGFRLATSIDGAVTGRGGDILIIDDPLKPADAFTDRRTWVNEWYKNTLVSRLDDLRTGAIIVVMQRLHDDDLPGALMRSGENWVHLKLPAIAEVEERIAIGPDRYHVRQVGDLLHGERLPRQVLEEINSLDPTTFAAHYQQAPILPGGVIIKRAWIKYYDELPIRNASSVILQSWDTASGSGGSGDWSVCTTWLIQDERFYLLDVLRHRFDYPTLRARAIAHAGAYRANKILIEDADVGRGLIQELKRLGLPVIAVRPERDKKTRIKVQSAKFEAGLVWFPKQAPWLSDYEAEIFAFPNVRFDDQVDSTSQAIASDPFEHDWDAVARGWERFAFGLALERLTMGW